MDHRLAHQPVEFLGKGCGQVVYALVSSEKTRKASNTAQRLLEVPIGELRFERAALGGVKVVLDLRFEAGDIR
jgi:hypothetical protein